MKLDSGQKNMLRLIGKGAGADGWADVSKTIMPLIEKLPSELVNIELVCDDGRGRVKLTDKGAAILMAMDYI